MKESPVFDDFYNLWLLLSQTRSAIFKVRHKKVGQYLHPNQAAALVSIWALDGQTTPAALARRLFLEPHSASELINRMQQKGLVTKKQDREKGNVVRITITNKGRQVCQQVMGQQLIHKLMSLLTAKQREQLRESLTVLYDAALEELGIEGEASLLAEDKDS
jgi:MarR family transcriptional regulator, organic hydroperoxide resistance regulator